MQWLKIIKGKLFKGKIMQLILTQKLLDILSGDVLKDAGAEVTLGLVCCNGLLVAPDKAEVKADKKVKRFELAMRLVNRDSADVTAEDIVLLKERINIAYSQPLIVGQVFQMLDACGNVKRPMPTVQDDYVPDPGAAADDGKCVEVDEV